MQLNQSKRLLAVAYLLLVFVGCKFVGCTKDEPVILIPKADFDFIITNSGTLPVLVKFRSISAHAETFKWEFDNGITSTLETPITRYSESKVFRVKLVVSNSAGEDSITREVQINRGHRPIRIILLPDPDM